MEVAQKGLGFRAYVRDGKGPTRTLTTPGMDIFTGFCNFGAEERGKYSEHPPLLLCLGTP